MYTLSMCTLFNLHYITCTCNMIRISSVLFFSLSSLNSSPTL